MFDEVKAYKKMVPILLRQFFGPPCIAAEDELALRTGQVKNAFANFRKLRSVTPHVTGPILDTSGQLLCDKKAKLAVHAGRNTTRICLADLP